MSDWFEDLTGFPEQSPDQVRAQLELQENILTSKVNGRSWHAGKLETPTLGELRRRVARLALPSGRLQVREVVADVRDLHADPENAGAAFQVASQFNLLEMADPDITPEQGVGIYQHDPTQGPACATSAGAGTIQRNYFTEVDGLPGQARDRQIDCLADLGRLLGNEDGRLWKMKNGYALASEEGLDIIGNRLLKADEAEIDALRRALRVGIQWHTEVTTPGCGHRVTQIFCSALPIGYSRHSPDSWAPFARLVLEAAYEATLCAALLNHEETGSPRIFLTLLGGGAFGNQQEWIVDAMSRALAVYSDTELDVVLVARGPGQGISKKVINGMAAAQPAAVPQASRAGSRNRSEKEKN